MSYALQRPYRLEVTTVEFRNLTTSLKSAARHHPMKRPLNTFLIIETIYLHIQI